MPHCESDMQPHFICAQTLNKLMVQMIIMKHISIYLLDALSSAKISFEIFSMKKKNEKLVI